MNRDDTDNLKFLLTLAAQSKEDLDKWFEQRPAEEIAYAIELLSQYGIARQQVLDDLLNH